MKFLKSLLISFDIFIVVSLITYISSKESANDFKLGFPFTFYEQFHLRGGDLLNFGSDIGAAIKDYAIIFLLVFLVLSIKNFGNKNWRLN